MSRNAWAAAPPLQFQRSEGPVHVRKPVRRSPLRLGHILALCLAAAAAFYGLTRLVLFLQTWEDLNIRAADVSCPNLLVRDLVYPLAKNAASGNIFLLDAARVKTAVESCSWVKEARVRKVFPSAIAVDVVPRIPEAVLESGGAWLIDRDALPIEPADPEDLTRLPLFRDSGLFAEDRELKLANGWGCLDALGPELRARVSSLDLSDAADVVLTFRDDPVRIRLGTDAYAEKAAEYLSRRGDWTAEYGLLEYVDFRISGRIFFKVISQEAR